MALMLEMKEEQDLEDEKLDEVGKKEENVSHDGDGQENDEIDENEENEVSDM